METLQKMKLEDYNINTEHWVNVTFINNPHSFYVRNRHYKQFYVAMGLSEPHTAIEVSDINVGLTVLFKSDLKDKFIRGNVIFVDTKEEICDIFAIDYGYLETCVGFNSIYQLTEACKELNLPPLAIHCQLANCEPFNGESWSADVTQAMKTFIGEGREKVKIIIRGQLNGKYLVDLEGPSLYDTATLLVLTGYSSMSGCHNSISKITVPETQKHFYTFKEIKEGDILHVRSLSGKSLEAFYVAEIEDYQKYLEDRAILSNYPTKLSNLSSDDIKKGRPVSVLRGLKYERAIIKEVINTKQLLVQLIDTGVTEKAYLSSVMKMSEVFFNRPVAAFYCSVDKSQSIDYRLQKFLLPGYEFLITIKQVGSKFDIPNIVEITKLPLSSS